MQQKLSMVFKRTIERKDFYHNFFKSINYVLNLTNLEINVISYIANTISSLPNDLTIEQKSAIAFSAANRKITSQDLDISIYNLNNYIKALRDKNIILGNNSRNMQVNPLILVELNSIGKEYINEFKFSIV